MKRFRLLLGLGRSLAACAPRETIVPLPTGIEDNLYRTGVNTSPYEYFPQAETPVPAGYKPFYISHYGRHGSRSDWGGAHYEKVLEAFGKAHEAGVLNEEGEKAYGTIQEIFRLHNDMNGRLTPRGAREHRAIAGRMYGKYKKVLGSGKIRAVSSTVPRCIVSMAAFTGELLSRNPKLDIGWDTGERFMEYCSSHEPKDLTVDAYKLITKHAESQKPDTVTFASHVFNDVDAGRAAVGGSIEKLLDGTLSFAAISGSFDQDDNLLRLYNLADLEHYARNVSLNLYLRQCNSLEFGDRRMAVPETVNCVEDVIAKADAAIADGEYAADFRFGHDYQLLAVSSLMGIKGIGERMTADEAVNWPCWQYSPFAGNLQMIFYKNAAGDVLVKFYINERETGLLGLEGGPYYKWEDVKQIWKSNE
jgi:hypothetical protein